ncbi:MAG: cysteine--tRNA ligase [Candidatus Marinimicrobia bacterium]|nr:cysteine--tRNA ligase [Candidatus Neomarinimicrobiota bacterium]
MIKFYNTKSRKREEFIPIDEGKVGLYTCGPTVYDFAHIGNFRAYIFEDLLRRFLSLSGFEVYHIMNITDIDDKTIRRSIEENRSLQDFTDEYVKSFHEDVETLRLLPAHEYPRATEFIPQMLDMVGQLEEKGFTYTTQDGSVFFKISEFDNYGSLAKLDPDQLRSGERVENDEYGKEEGRDFALWKGHKDSESNVSWESPWGNGRPGWHLECSAMSTHYLGNHFDIHCGGVDNIFPHHENEIAQSCAATGEEFVNYWLHNEHLLVESQKMSKSEGNFYTLRQLLEMGYSPESLRYTLISTHYRQKLNFTFDKIKSSQKCVNKLRELKRRALLIDIDAEGKDVEKLSSDMLGKFQEKLGDDLNISGALGELFVWVNDIFSQLDNNEVSVSGAGSILSTLNTVDLVLCVINDTCNDEPSEEIDVLIIARNDARANMDWSKADEIRDKLDALGVVLEDTQGGTIWKRK